MRTKREPQEEPRPLTMDEVIDHYRDKWILLHVTDFDDRHQPIAGHIVAMAKTAGPVWRKFEKLRAQRAGAPGGPYYIFNAFPRIHSGAAWQEVLDRAAREGPPRGFRWW